jgi:hypothetical protein
MTTRVNRWLAHHGYDPPTVVGELLVSAVDDGRWLDSCVLGNGLTADEYVAEYDGEAWYLKFYMDEVRAIVNVWSCWWQGTAH